MKVKEMKRKETDYQKREKEMKYKEPRQARIGNKKLWKSRVLSLMPGVKSVRT